MSPTRVVAVAFALIILTGGLLLTLPAAARDGQSHSFLTGLFTATSATCVTGLVLGDTWTLWSGFGQIVILCLIEIGGLGFMSVASTVIFLLKRKLGLRHRMVMAQALSVSDMASVVRLQKWAVLGSIAIQLTGALILTLRFLPDFGLEQAATWGIFHAVSAFCNAGFDIFGKIAPNASVIVFNNDPVVCITIMALIVIGGLGFFVWEELVRVRTDCDRRLGLFRVGRAGSGADFPEIFGIHKNGADWYGFPDCRRRFLHRLYGVGQHGDHGKHGAMAAGA